MKYLNMSLLLAMAVVQVSCMPQKEPESFSGRVAFTETNQKIIFRIKTNLKPIYYLITRLQIINDKNEVITIYFDENKMEVKTDQEYLYLIIDKKSNGSLTGHIIWIYLSAVEKQKRELYIYKP